MPSPLKQRAAVPMLPSRRAALLQTVSISALLLTCVAPSPGRAAPFRSLQAALAQGSRAAVAATAPFSGITAAKQAQLGAQNLAAASARFASLSQALAAASNGGAIPNAANGYGANAGLQLGDGVGVTAADGSIHVANSTLWSGAEDSAGKILVGQTSSATGTTVTVTQTKSVAQLTWKSFDVGSHTTLKFDQSAGGTLASSWVAINKLQDAATLPSQILGAIQATGKVYVINRNGIAFGRGAAINVGSLIAATANIAQAQFGTDAAGNATFNLYGTPTTGGSTPATFAGGPATSSVTVAPGAAITTTTPTGNAGGGYVMLFGGYVENEGQITTPNGQTVLAAGTNFALRAGYSPSANTTSTTLGSEVSVTGTSPLGGVTIGQGAVTNGSTGLIFADQGDISLIGHSILQDGVLMSTTTVNTRGTVHLLTDLGDRSASIVLGPHSLTEILPLDNGQTALDTQRKSNTDTSTVLNALRASAAQSGVITPLNDISFLADQFGSSRIELSSGGNVDVQSGALAITPGGQVAIGATSRILLENGSTIDVSGSNSALLPSSVNDLLINLQPYQLRDSASNRTGPLRSGNVYVDARTLVQTSYAQTASVSGNIYTQGGLIEVGGYVGLVPHGITEWTASGGQVILQATLPATGSAAASGEVITQPGSVINLTGGTISYAAGPVKQSYLITDGGAIYNANTAPGNLVYAGVYDGTQIIHPRWNVTDTYNNPLLTPAVLYDPAYSVGRDAGTITVNAPTAVLQGAIPAGVTLGDFQNTARPATVADPYTLAQSVVPLAGTFQYGNYIAGSLITTGSGSSFNPQYPGTVSFETSQAGAAPASIAAPLDPLLVNTVTIDARSLSEDGFANVAAITNGTIRVGAPVAVADGGTLTLDGHVVQVSADLTARGGSINLANLVTQGTLTAILGSATGTDAASGGIVSLATGATLDARGLYTNAVLDPSHIAGEGLANGGRVNITSYGALVLPAGSRIDVSAGGAQLAGGKQLTATGGSVSISADYIPVSATVGTDPVFIGATFAAYGSKGGGILSIVAPDIVLGTGAVTVLPSTVILPLDTFSTGFSSYVLNGVHSLDVLPGAQITVVEPVAVLTNGLAVPTGGDPSSAYSIILPDLFTPVPGTDRLTKRLGASLTLTSILPALPSDTSVIEATGTVTVDAGANVLADPGQSIIVEGGGQATILGTLTAQGGSIAVATKSSIPFPPSDVSVLALNYVAGRSVWIGNAAVLNASGFAASAADASGHRYGTVSAGGTITLGGDGGLVASGGTTDAQVLVRPGAMLNASGTSLTVDVIPGTMDGSLQIQAEPITLASDGGTIVARSQTGIALDGTMLAQAGGAGASGGALVLRNDVLPPSGGTGFLNVPPVFYQPQQIVVTNHAVRLDSNGLEPGEPTPYYAYNVVRISQDQIDAGGFAQLSLAGATVFDGSVNLSLSRALVLGASLVSDTLPNSTVTISAPYVQLTNLGGGASGSSANGTVALTGTFQVDADLIDLQGSVSIQHTQYEQLGAAGSASTTLNTYGFDRVRLDSTGDIRLLGASLTVDRALTLIAAQVYPGTGTINTLTAGNDANAPLAAGALVNRYEGGSISIERASAATPAAPYSVGGSVILNADTVVQDGVLRAPEGQITLGVTDNVPGNGFEDHTTSVTLGADSITSLSLDGQTIPYGGTVDGSTYTYNGNMAGTFSPSVTINTQSFVADPAATLDISGGGTLSGAAFIPGRGGSVDVLKTPLLSEAGAVAVNTTNQVYAILPGYNAAYAPVAPDDANYSLTGIGRQITVGSDVPGLAAGTYTLLPAYYALQPGGYRVEITSGTVPANTANSVGNFTAVAPVTLGVANTGIAASTPVAALFTNGAGLRQLAQYNEESYSSFEIGQAANFGTPRPFLPQDAKTVSIVYPQNPGDLIKFSLGAASLVQAPAADGRGATLEISSNSNNTPLAPIVLLGDGGTAPSGSVGIEASVLSALQIPRLVLGGVLTPTNGSNNSIDVVGASSAVTITPQATVAAGDVLITVQFGGTIDFQSTTGSNGATQAATITTLGEPASALDLSRGFYFSTAFSGNAYPAVDISNGQIVFTPNTFSSEGAQILVAEGVNLLAGGSLNFVSPDSTSVGFGGATLSAKDLTLAVSTINFGTQTGFDNLQQTLPTGLNIDSDTFGTLTGGESSGGTEGVGQLLLTATKAVNFIGGQTLDSGNTNFAISTPAIYGYGVAGTTDLVRIKAPTFTWSGVAFQVVDATTQAVSLASVTPGGQIRGSGQSIIGTLLVDAPGGVVLGYGPQTQPDDQVMLDRLLAGFDNVTLQSSNEITANNQSSLSVYSTVDTFGTPGAGGNLTLDAPVITAESAALLKVTAGGALLLANTSGSAASTGTITSQGGEIDFSAASIAAAGATVSLPAGRLTATAAGAISLDVGTTIDLAGRTTQNFDQSVNSQGGTLLLESTGAGITDAAAIDVSSPGSNAGSLSFSALQGAVDITGPITGTAAPDQVAGGISILAGSLTEGLSALDALLDTGQIYHSRSVEVAAGDLVIAAGETLTAHSVSLTADTGAVTIDGTIDASGSKPGNISLSAGGNLTLDATAVLNASATATATDSYGQPIDAENRAHVTLTSTGAGTLILNGSPAIDVSYPGSSTDPQGQVVFNVQRIADGTNPAAIAGDAAIAVSGTPNIVGANAINLFAFTAYSPTDTYGTIQQCAYGCTPVTGAVNIDSIAADNTAFMANIAATGLIGKLGGLTGYGAHFHLAPGVEIDSSDASSGNLTVSGDLDFSGLRVSDPVGFGRRIVAGVEGSGEAGSIVFRAANQLTVNGSISDGFAHPSDVAVAQANGATSLPQDSGWQYFISRRGTAKFPTGADILLPESSTGTFSDGTTTNQIVLHGSFGGPATVFITGRPVSLNYGITIRPASILANTVLPFGAELGDRNIIPAGGWIATADILSARPGLPRSEVVFAKGQFIPAGTKLKPGFYLSPGTVLPTEIALADKTYVPPGMLLSIFAPGNGFSNTPNKITLRKDTDVLPANAFIPSDTRAVFYGLTDSGDSESLSSVALRPAQTDGTTGFSYQGLLYPIAPLLSAGQASWGLSLVAGANVASADRLGVQAKSALLAQTPDATAIYQDAGSVILDDPHYAQLPTSRSNGQDAFSVIRTGTGDLNLVAGGNFDQRSLYGIYTAGTQTPIDTPLQSLRAAYGTDGALLQGNLADPASATLNALVTASYSASYPSGGGDFSLLVQGDASGDTAGATGNAMPSASIGNWLWRQGSPPAVGSFSVDQPVAWWIDYGTFTSYFSASAAGVSPYLVGFQGLGTLGGGNVTVRIGGNAAQTTGRGPAGSTLRGEGLVVAVGGTATPAAGSGPLTYLGGGNLIIDVGGAFADGAGSPASANSTVINLRGGTSVSAGAIGQIGLLYTTAASDPRVNDPFVVKDGAAGGGLTLVPGDSASTITALRDAVVATALDPGTQTQANATSIAITNQGTLQSVAGTTSFSLWTGQTSIALFSTGGNATPITVNGQTALYPTTLSVIAASGDIIYGSQGQTILSTRLETAPSQFGDVSFLAAGSIYANGLPIDMSGQDPMTVPRPADPLISLNNGFASNSASFGVDTPTTNLHAGDTTPARFYAASGDIVGFQSGETVANNGSVTFLAAKPVWEFAGNDIVSNGTRPLAGPLQNGFDPSLQEFAIQQNFIALGSRVGGAFSSGSVFLNNDANSISVISAGRDILSSYVYVGGPGLLEVDAGRNINQTGQSTLTYGSIKSIGSLISGAAPSLTGGAGIAVLAGIGAGPDYTGFAALYLDQNNQANLDIPISDPSNKGRVQHAYSAELLAWLQANYGYTGTQADALAFFDDDDNLSPIERDVFLREVFFDETVASGRQFNDPASRFFGSYIRGRQAIDTLFPSTPPNADLNNGTPVGYSGAITMASGNLPLGPLDRFNVPSPIEFDAGIATLHGGDVEVLNPGGELLLGTQGGVTPGAGTGIVTYGTGSIDIYTLDSVLLGQSRIFTTAGGDIAIWSSQGDINAGVGSKTTVTFSPPTISYDTTGGLTLQPTVPVGGAGIATLSPIAGIPAGNIDLTAPLGTIDSGEAGIRASGNINFAAATIITTGGVSSGGKTVGIPTVPTVSVSSTSAASGAAGAAANTAQTAGAKRQAADNGTIIEVEVLSVTGGDTEEKKRRRSGI